MERTKEFDLLLSVTVGLVRTGEREPADRETKRLVEEALKRMVPPEGFENDGEQVRRLAERIREKKAELLPDCAVCPSPCGRFFDYDPEDFWLAGEEMREIKTGILKQLSWLNERGLLEEHWDTACRALFALGEDWGKEWFQTIAEELKGVLYCPGRE